jgi:hypothetical protein
LDGVGSINVTLPRTLQALGIPTADLIQSNTPFFGIIPDKYQTEFLRFKVARIECGYNVIIGRPGLAKFKAILHYPCKILKMPGP